MSGKTNLFLFLYSASLVGLYNTKDLYNSYLIIPMCIGH
jgi:hypothetical protein